MEVNNNNINQNVKNQNPAFKGKVGERLLKEIAESRDTIELSTMVKEAKGTFGFNKETLHDIVESFVGKIRELQESLPKKQRQRHELVVQCESLPNEYQVEDKARRSVYARYVEKDEALAQQSKESLEELETAQKEAKKYEPMKEVKSVEELGIMMPEQVMELIDEIAANKKAAADSMLEFLTGSGKGKEALAQIERFKKLSAARNNGMFMIPELSEHLRANSTNIGNPAELTIDLIGDALKANPRGIKINGYDYRYNKIKEQSMTILKPLYEDLDHYEKKNADHHLEKTLNDVVDFHEYFERGKEVLLSNNSGCKMVDNPVIYDTRKSNIELIAPNGNSMAFSYDQIAYIGKSSGRRY